MKPRADALPRRVLMMAAACLALPFLCFALWDALLSGAGAASFAPDTSQALPAAGRQNTTACLLYGCVHSLNLPLQGGTEGWTLDTEMPRARQVSALQSRLDPLQQAGVLHTSQRLALTLALDNTACYSLERYTAGGGLEQYRLQRSGAQEGPGPGYPQLFFQAVFTAEGVPVYLDFQGGPAVEALTLDQMLELSGLTCFADWQPQALAGCADTCGAALYSASAQLYARIGCGDGFTYRLVSMTPADMQALQQDSTSP